MLIALDPSINNTGYAIFKKTGEYVCSGVIRSKRGQSDIEKLACIGNGLREIVLKQEIMQAAIEEPPSIVYRRSISNTTGKSMNQDSLRKLNMAIGTILSVFAGERIPVVMIPVSKWKGGRKKELDIIVARQVTGKKKISSDEADAIGIGMFFLKTKKIGA